MGRRLLPEERTLVPAAPFVEWLDRHCADSGIGVRELARRLRDATGQLDPAARLRVIRKQQTVSVYFVDAVACALGHEELVAVLYGDSR